METIKRIIYGSKPPPVETPPPPPPESFGVKLKKSIFVFWRGIFSVIWPILWLPLLIIHWENDAYRCLYLVVVMAGYWVTECLPLGITSTIPIFYFPLMGIMNTADVCYLYFSETNVMFIGGIMIALAIEHSKLHYRIALGFILLCGCSPRRLHFGIMTVTMFISWWISNTACTAMMCPIILAVLEELEKQGVGSVYIKDEEKTTEGEEEKRPTDCTLAYFLAAAYSSTIGGCATLVGTGTNLTYRGLYEQKFPDSDGIEFGRWILMNGPTMFVLNMVTWLILEVRYLGLFRPKSPNYQLVQQAYESKAVAEQVLKKKFKELGKMSWHESWVLGLFLLCVCLWFFRNPGFIEGWTIIQHGTKIKDATVAFFIVVLMFLIPAQPLFPKAFSSNPEERPKKCSEGLLTWKVLHQKVPWGLMFLLGGGFALEGGSRHSGMSEMVSDWLSGLKVLPVWLIMSFMAIAASFMTELSSNVAIANIVIPIALQLAVKLNTDPLFLSMPTAVACSFAFMMPVGTPPNAIVTAFVNVPTSQMALTGFMVSIVTIIIYIGVFLSWGRIVYGFS